MMLEIIEVKPLPQRCIDCEEKAKLYFAADEAEKLRMEIEEDFYFDCGSCDYALDRFIIKSENKGR